MRYGMLILILLIALPATSPGNARPTQSDACPVALPAGAAITCGYLSVPERRDRADSPTIRLPYLVIKSRSAAPAPDPIVYTSGGPGASSLRSVRFWVNSAYLER
ncbi:MAG TPA: hypothetical protein VD886_10865, partial [Herpetosiphonaceae bacterium]|nr:hypothetical protein [Herpetosiphonaceae bacterium]